MSRLRTAMLAAALVLVIAAPASDAAKPSRPVGPTVVVALADTGVNPYHQVFYRPQLTRHPCTWLPGFTDCSIPALELSIGKYKTYEQAYEADRDIWEGVEPHQWYWIPRTNIIGAVCDVTRGGSAAAADPTCILDDDGHGTATASSVLSEAPDALLLISDSKSTAPDLKTAPVEPDVRSHSWAPAAPIPLQAADPTPGDETLCEPLYAPQTVYFIAAGNEAPWPTMLDCDRQNIDIQVVGGSYPGSWNYNSWSGYDFASWYCRPAALHASINDEDRKCGTSLSAPTAAGAAADAMLRIRRHDRFAGRSTPEKVSTSVTRDEFILALRNAATYHPQAKYPVPSATSCVNTYVTCFTGWAPMAPGTEHVHWGYGWLDSTVTSAIVDCALRRSCPPKSAEATEWNERRQELRTTPWNDVIAPFPQDDAGSQHDAGHTRRTAVPIVPDKEYTGHLEPYGVSGDLDDWYSFRAVAGQEISVTSYSYVHQSASAADLSGVAGCWTVYDAAGKIVGNEPSTSVHTYGCSSTRVNAPPTDVLVERSGTYSIVYSSHNGTPPHDYEFTLSLTR